MSLRIDEIINILVLLNIALIIAHLSLDGGLGNAVARMRQRREEKARMGNSKNLEEIAVISGVPAGETVYNGFGNDTCTAPSKEGVYTLFEVADPKTNTHQYWYWKEGIFPALTKYKKEDGKTIKRKHDEMMIAQLAELARQIHEDPLDYTQMSSENLTGILSFFLLGLVNAFGEIDRRLCGEEEGKSDE